MKLRITRKKNKKDIASINLDKAVRVRQIPDGRKKFILEITFGRDCCFAYKDSEYIFEELELSGAGMLYAYERTVPEIVECSMID